jgi:hypothetical protein
MGEKCFVPEVTAEGNTTPTAVPRKKTQHQLDFYKVLQKNQTMLETHSAPRSSLLADLWQLGRILFLRRAHPGSLSPDVGKLPWLALLYGLLGVGLSIILLGRKNGAIAIDSTVFIPFGAVALLAGALKWIDDHQNGARLWLAFTLLLTLLPVAGFIGAEAWPILAPRDAFANNPWLGGVMPNLLAMLPHLWLALAGTIFVMHGPHGNDWRRGLYIPLTAIALIAVFTSNDPLSLWRVTTLIEAPDDESDGLIIDEEILYGQARILNERLASIQPGKPGVPEIFFLGIAGSEEGVFMRETIAVEQLFKERYATPGHTLILVNHPATAKRLPFANRESLTQALQRIGKQMNGEEDLLFLFLTSHGSADHQFSIKLWPFEFPALTPKMLRKALDDSGIKRKVVVISSCYAGGFIPAIADANTLVITAASADRTSFGCDDDNDLTDFGRAYFSEALTTTRSFTEAFEQARATIAEREKDGNYLPSQPQIAGGEALQTQLEWFARPLKTPAPAEIAPESKPVVAPKKPTQATPAPKAKPKPQPKPKPKSKQKPQPKPQPGKKQKK